MNIKQKTITIVIGIISILLAIIEYFLLPEIVTIQINYRGESILTAPKIIAIMLLLSITLFGLLVYNLKDKDKGIVVSIVGLIISVIMLIENR